MVISLIICIPLSFVLGGFLTWKSVQLGLKWQRQMENKQEPELKNPIKEAVNERKADDLNRQREQFMKEYNPFQ